ncbi:MAG: type II toxin-antitoxin system VapC family toxin [Bacteroidota bacterium]
MDPSKPYVFDSWPVISFFENQPSANKIERLLEESVSNKIDKYLSVINLGEIWYTICRTYSDTKADLVVQKLRDMGFLFIDANWHVTQQAAAYKTLGGISYADCFAAALAKTQDAVLITGDKEFKRVAHDVDILWV